MNKLTKKILTVTTAAALLTGGGVAFAYWTAGGSGEGTAATGTTTPLSAVQTSTVTDMRPGDEAQTLSGTFTNPVANGPVHVTSVTAVIASVTVPKVEGSLGCSAADYTLANATMTVGREVVTGTGWTGATIKFNNISDKNQDGCKGATVNLKYTIL
jgi:hypothetical protein